MERQSEPALVADDRALRSLPRLSLADVQMEQPEEVPSLRKREGVLMRWFRRSPKGVHTYTFSREMTPEELEETSAHMEAAFARFDEAFAEFDKVFKVLRKGDDK